MVSETDFCFKSEKDQYVEQIDGAFAPLVPPLATHLPKVPVIMILKNLTWQNFIYMKNKLFMFYNVSFFFSQIIILQEIHSFIFAN